MKKYLLVSISISALTISLVITYYLVIFVPNKEKAKLKLEQTKLELQLEKIVNDENKRKNEAIQNENETQIKLVLLNYKVDASKNTDMVNTLLTALNNDPMAVCPSIIEQAANRNHIYYLYVDYYNGLEREYGKYRDLIPYIDTNLNGEYGIIKMIKDQCKTVGYQIS